MKVVMVANHSCVRVHKMGLPLIEGGQHKVHLIAHRHASFSEVYSTFGHWFDLGNLASFIKLHAPNTDVFHCHNEPSFFVTLIKEMCDVPVILDVHDSFLARVTPEEKDENPEVVRISIEERNNFQLADALVFPSQPFADLIRNEFKLTQPYIILPSYLPRRLYRYNAVDWMGGLVYEGKIQMDVTSKASFGFRYCDYKDFAQKAHDIGLKFHLYAGRNNEDKEFMKAYNDIAFVHKPYVYDELLKNIGRHDWGLVGNLNYTREWEVAMPNKLFDYIAAGVPIVAINAKECGKFVREHGIGIEVKSLEELFDRWEEHTEIRKVLLKKRLQFSMDKNLQPLKDLYNKLHMKEYCEIWNDPNEIDIVGG